MKLGYQDVGSATLLKSTPVDRRKAAWLYLQFIVSKTTSLKKSHVGLTFIRESDIWDKSFTERAPKLGGLIEFYRSPARAVDPDRQQRAGLSEAGAIVVAEHRRCVVRCEDAAGRDGFAGRSPGLGDGAA
jgi:ABC-type glycerol-3-phosphate transport system substrate-binding protein